MWRTFLVKFIYWAPHKSLSLPPNTRCPSNRSPSGPLLEAALRGSANKLVVSELEAIIYHWPLSGFGFGLGWLWVSVLLALRPIDGSLAQVFFRAVIKEMCHVKILKLRLFLYTLKVAEEIIGVRLRQIEAFPNLSSIYNLGKHQKPSRYSYVCLYFCLESWNLIYLFCQITRKSSLSIFVDNSSLFKKYYI